jgi:hypothetical protein
VAAKRNASSDAAILETLQTILIVQLAQSGLNNHSIAKIAGVHVTRVIPIAKAVKTKTKRD